MSCRLYLLVLGNKCSHDIFLDYSLVSDYTKAVEIENSFVRVQQQYSKQQQQIKPPKLHRRE